MAGMLDKFHAEVEKAFGAADRHRTRVGEIKKQADKNPELVAARIVEVVPECLREKRATALESFGIDLADAEAVRSFKASSVAEWQVVYWLATYYQIYEAFLRFIDLYFEDPRLTAEAVCEAFLKAVERQLYRVVLNFHELQKALPAEEFPAEELAKVLSGIVATRMSLEGKNAHVRLRAAIDELRERSEYKSAKRERLEQLLKELPSQVLDVWYGTAHPMGDLSEIRTKAAHRVAGLGSEASSKPENVAGAPVEEAPEQGTDKDKDPLGLGDWAAREEAARQWLDELEQAAKLSPQQKEVWWRRRRKKMEIGEIAAELNISENHVSVQLHYANEKLRKAGEAAGL